MLALCISYLPTRKHLITFYLILIRMLGDSESQYYLDEIYVFLFLLPLGHFFLNPQGLCKLAHTSAVILSDFSQSALTLTFTSISLYQSHAQRGTFWTFYLVGTAP